MKLTPAQKREYDILKEYGICTICDTKRNKVYLNLVKKGLADCDKRTNHPVVFTIKLPLNDQIHS